MKLIRLFFISIIAFFLLLTVVSLFIPSSVTVSRATNIAPGSVHILQHIADLRQWKNWHPQFNDIVLKNGIEKNNRVTSAIANGIRLTVVASSDTTVSVEMKKGEHPVVNNWKLIKYMPGDSLTIQNYIYFDVGWYPWDKFSSLMLDGSYGPVMEQGLQNLKNISD